MSRLHSAFARLFLPDPASPGHPAPTAADLLDEQGCTRALVLELAAPADWDLLRTVWQGVQADLGLPAPAIAVSGADGIQLWFTAPAPVPAADAQRWLEALCRRYLPGVKAQRLRLFPRGDAAAADGAAGVHAEPVPTAQPDGEKWSAFVAPDLVALFTDTPWLDSEPGEDGQGALLERIGVMRPGWFEAGLGRDAAGGEATEGAASQSSLASPLSPSAPSADERAGATAGAGWRHEAALFLQRVMNDETASLAVRVEAARVLLHAPGEPGGR
jgi:hypothetical protein